MKRPERIPMTVDQHREVGAALHETSRRFQDLFYRGGLKASLSIEQARKWLDMVDRIDQVRSSMDRHFAREHPVEFGTRVPGTPAARRR